MAASSSEGALAGLRVVDFTHYVAGPLATMILADAGADVIKIEKPRGDDQRFFPPADPRLGGEGASFFYANRNKRSVTLDLKTAEGRAIAREVVRSADVVVENFTSGVMDSYGLDYVSLAKEQPRLIYCSVSAFGRTGDLAHRPGFDTIMQAESGFMSMTGYADRDGVRTGPAVIDMATAMMASNAILLALAARERTGRGQHVDVPLFDTAVLMTGFMTSQYLFSGKVPKRNGNTSNDVVPSGVFHAKDGPIFITCSSTALFRRLFNEALQMPGIGEDPGLQLVADRIAQRDRITGALQDRLSQHSRDHWLELFAKAGVPAGAVRTLPEAVESHEMKSRNLISYVPHGSGHDVPSVALPIRMTDTPMVAPVAPPLLGQHTREVLADVLGYDEARIAQLAAAGALGPAR